MYIIEQIELKNFIGLSKVSNEEDIYKLDLSQDIEKTFFLLYGENGQGKTTLLESLTPYSNMISRDIKESIIFPAYKKIIFLDKTRDFRLRLEIQYKSETETKGYIYENDNKEPTIETSKGNITEYNSEINRIFGDFNKFKNSLFLQQGVLEIVRATPTERIKIINNFISDLDIYKTIKEKAKAKAEEKKSQAIVLEEQVNELKTYENKYIQLQEYEKKYKDTDIAKEEEGLKVKKTNLEKGIKQLEYKDFLLKDQEKLLSKIKLIKDSNFLEKHKTIVEEVKKLEKVLKEITNENSIEELIGKKNDIEAINNLVSYIENNKNEVSNFDNLLFLKIEKKLRNLAERKTFINNIIHVMNEIEEYTSKLKEIISDEKSKRDKIFILEKEIKTLNKEIADKKDTKNIVEELEFYLEKMEKLKSEKEKKEYNLRQLIILKEDTEELEKKLALPKYIKLMENHNLMTSEIRSLEDALKTELGTKTEQELEDSFNTNNTIIQHLQKYNNNIFRETTVSFLKTDKSVIENKITAYKDSLVQLELFKEKKNRLAILLEQKDNVKKNIIKVEMEVKEEDLNQLKNSVNQLRNQFEINKKLEEELITITADVEGLKASLPIISIDALSTLSEELTQYKRELNHKISIQDLLKGKGKKIVCDCCTTELTKEKLEQKLLLLSEYNIENLKILEKKHEKLIETEKQYEREVTILEQKEKLLKEKQEYLRKFHISEIDFIKTQELLEQTEKEYYIQILNKKSIEQLNTLIASIKELEDDIKLLSSANISEEKLNEELYKYQTLKEVDINLLNLIKDDNETVEKCVELYLNKQEIKKQKLENIKKLNNNLNKLKMELNFHNSIKEEKEYLKKNLSRLYQDKKNLQINEERTLEKIEFDLEHIKSTISQKKVIISLEKKVESFKKDLHYENKNLEELQKEKLAIENKLTKSKEIVKDQKLNPNNELASIEKDSIFLSETSFLSKGLENKDTTFNDLIKQKKDYKEQYESIEKNIENYWKIEEKLKISIAIKQEFLSKEKELSTYVEESSQKEKEIKEITTTYLEIEKNKKDVNLLELKIKEYAVQTQQYNNDKEWIEQALEDYKKTKNKIEDNAKEYEIYTKIKRYSDRIKQAFVTNFFSNITGNINKIIANNEGTLGQLKVKINQTRANRFDIVVVNPNLFKDKDYDVKDISLLSGAEQATIARAIYFALAEYSSFGVLWLDEFDGMLSETNKSVFIDMLKKIKEIIDIHQFFIISHNKELIPSVDRVIRF